MNTLFSEGVILGYYLGGWISPRVYLATKEPIFWLCFLLAYRFISCAIKTKCLLYKGSKNITRSELIVRVRRSYGCLDLSEQQVDEGVRALFDIISEHLSQGHRIELRNFGTFECRHRSAYTAYICLFKEWRPVPEKTVPFFRAGRGLKRQVNESLAA